MDFPKFSLLITVTLAFLGYLITYWNNLRISKRKERLNLITKRISDFYGPLFIATHTNKRAFQSLVKKLGRESALFTDKAGLPTDKEFQEWRLWMINILMPKNELIEKLILEKAYLIRENQIPECLLKFITHISGYKINIRQWENGDYSERLSIIDFPAEIEEYASNSFNELKDQQVKLMGKIK